LPDLLAATRAERLDRVAATPADTIAARPAPSSNTLQIDAESKIGRSVGRRQHPAEL